MQEEIARPWWLSRLAQVLLIWAKLFAHLILLVVSEELSMVLLANSQISRNFSNTSNWYAEVEHFLPLELFLLSSKAAVADDF